MDRERRPADIRTFKLKDTEQSLSEPESLGINDRLEVSCGTQGNFFVHSYRQRTRMLAYVQYYKSTDHSSRMPDVRWGKVVQFNGDEHKKVLCVTSIDARIDIMTSRERRYFINRNNVLDEND